MSIMTKAGHRISLLSLLAVLSVQLGSVFLDSTLPPPVPNGIYPYNSFFATDKIYQSGPTSYQQTVPNLVQFETVKRSQQEDIQLTPAMQQLASSLLAASANSAANFETPEQQQQNYSVMDNEFFSNPSLFGNYFMNSQQQYYPSMDPTGAASSFAISPSAIEQYASLLQANQSTLGKHKVNKQGLGRRIGELVSNSAERASRAFKSFSQFKLFNDIKPSRLLGLVSDQQSPDAKVVNATALSAAPSSAWYYPPSANPWSSYVSQSPSFYQQPVYVRTGQEMGANAASPASAVGSLNSLVNPSSVSPSMHTPKSASDYLSSLSDFYPQKLDNSPMYNSVVGTQANAQFPTGSSSTNVPLGTSTTTVYHHFSGDSNQNSGNNNQQPQDLFAAPQTQFGVRMKPPKDFEFDGSNEEDMGASGEQDDAKMADNSNGPNGGRNSMDNNNEGQTGNDRYNDRPHGGGQSGNSLWSGGNSGTSFDEYPEQNGGMEQDLFNAYNPNNGGGQRFRPFNTGHSSPNRPNPFRAATNARPYLSGIRRPMSLPADYDEPDNWYNTFLGNNVKPMSRLRNLPFSSGSPLNFASHSHHHPSASSLLNSAASTQTPTSLSPDSYMSPYGMSNSMRASDSHTPSFFHFPSAQLSPRPHWPYGLYSHPAANSYMNFRPNPMMTAATAVRPVTMPYFPAAANYFMPRYPPTAQSIFRTYPTAFPAGYTAPTAMPSSAATSLMGANPFTMPRYPAMAPFSMMPSASSMYPVRVPFSPMMSMAASMPFGMGMGSSLMPTIAQPPMMRYRFGADMSPSAATRRAMNITKRAEVGGAIDLVDQASSVLSKVSQVIANTLPSVKGITRSKTTTADNSVVPNREEQNLATLYNAYQVLQRRMESDSSSREETSSINKSQPYYQYYIGRDTTTTSTVAPATSTLASVDSSEQLDSSARAIPLNFTSISSRSIKTRHIKDQLLEHEKRQDEIRKFLTEASTIVSNSTVSPSSTTTRPVFIAPIIRQAKAVSAQIVAPNEWRPIFRSATVRKRN